MRPRLAAATVTIMVAASSRMIATAFRSSSSRHHRRPTPWSSPSPSSFSVAARRRIAMSAVGGETKDASSSSVSSSSSSASAPPAVAVASPSAYPFSAVETKWQNYWSEYKTFATPNRRSTTDDGIVVKCDRKKKYVLDMFPYPSGAGLHVGHPEGYTGEFVSCSKVSGGGRR